MYIGITKQFFLPMKQLIKTGPLLVFLTMLSAFLLLSCNSQGAQPQSTPEPEPAYSGICSCDYFTTEGDAQKYTFPLSAVNHIDPSLNYGEKEKPASYFTTSLVYLNVGGDDEDGLIKLIITGRDAESLKNCLHSRKQNCPPPIYNQSGQLYKPSEPQPNLNQNDTKPLSLNTALFNKAQTFAVG